MEKTKKKKAILLNNVDVPWLLVNYTRAENLNFPYKTTNQLSSIFIRYLNHKNYYNFKVINVYTKCYQWTVTLYFYIL